MASDIKKNTREERAAQFAAHLQNNSLNNYLRTSEAPKVEEETRDRTGEWLDKGKRIYGRMIMQSLLPGSTGVFAAGELLGKVARTIAPEAVERVEDFLSPTVDTVRHGVDTVKEGAFKSLEGVVDWGAGIVGSFGNENFRDNVQDFIERDYVGDWFDQDYYQERKEESVINEGGFVENALSAAGGMLPAIGLSVINPALGQAALFAGAAGNASEQAYQDGAGYYAGQIYGNVVGGIELGTEMLTGAIGKFGKGAFDDVIRSIAPSGAARWALNAVGEGLEEGTAEGVSPLAKVIYKGADALQEYKTGDYWRGVGESVALGTTLGGAFGMANVGANADIRAAQEEIGAIRERSTQQKASGKFTDEKAARADSDTLANLRVIESTLKKADTTKRAKLIADNGLSGMFESDGSLRMDYADALAGKSGYNRNSYSENLRGEESVIAEDLAKVNAELGLEGDEAITVHNGEFTAEERAKYSKVQKVVDAFAKKSGRKVGLVILSPNAHVNGNLTPDSGRVYISADNLTNGNWADTVVHEFTHFAEGTAEYSNLVQMLSSDAAITERAIDAVMKKGYGFDVERMRMVDERIKNGAEDLSEEDLIAYAAYQSEVGAHMSAEMLGNEAFIDRIIRSDAGLAEKIIGKIVDAKEALARIGDPEAQVQHKRLAAAEKLYLKAIEAAGYQYVNGKIVVPEEKKENTAEGGVDQEVDRVKYSLKIKHTDGSIEEIADARDLTNEQAIAYLKQAKKGSLQRSTYIPIRKDTPQVIIDALEQENEFIENCSMVMQVKKARQSMGDENPGNRKGRKGSNVRRHGLSPEEIVAIVNQLDNPTYIVYQTNRTDENGNSLPNNIVVFVEYKTNGNEGVAVVEFNPNLKNEIGEEFGDTRYHTVVTAFEPDVIREGEPFDYLADELLLNPNNILLKIERGQDARSATGEKHPNTSSKMPSNPIIPEVSEKSTPKSKFSLKENDGADGKRPTSYTKEEARGLVDRVMTLFSGEGYSGALPGKRAEAIRRAHAILNGAEPSKRASAALDFADYLIRSAVLEDDVTANPYYEVHVQTLEALKPYLRRLDLDSIRGDIQHRYDDRARAVFARWGKTKNARAVHIDQMVEELRGELGYDIGDHVNLADMFFEIDRDYCEARDALKENAKTAVREVFTEKEQKALRQQIAKEVLAAYDGRDFSRSTLVKIANKYADDVERLTAENRRLAEEARKSRAERDRAIAEKNDAKEKAAKAKAETKDVEEFNKVANRVIKLVNGIKDWKKGAFENAADAKNGTFKNIFGLLGNIASRGNISPITTRKAMAAIGEWYGNPKKHPVVEDLKKSKLYDESMLEEMEAIGSGEGALTVEELRAVEGILRHVKHIVENYNKTFYGGKYVEVKPLAEDFIAIAEENQRIHPGVISRVMKGKFMSFVTRPISVMRYHDRYNKNGFLTTMFLEFRKGALAAELAKQQMRKPLEDFYREHSDFLGDIKHKKITVEGVEMTRAEALSLYMTAKREQAVGGIMAAGFNVRDAKTQEMRGMKGLLETEDMQGEVDLIALQEATSKFRRRLWDGFTADERRFIEIAEDILNNDCKARKSKVDEIRLGNSNVLEEYYYPIRRGHTAQEIGDDTLGSELGRIRSFSFNKATVTGAKGKLFIEPADVVLERHIAGIALYENLSIPIDNYNRIANIDVSGNKNAPKTVIKVIQEKGGWAEAGKYFDKMIEDLEGIRVDKDWSTDALAFIRTGSVKFQLGANPKTWITQLSSLFASMSVIHPKYLGTTGFRVDGAELDTYSPLAMLRNMENTAAKAQGVMENVGAVGDKLMKPIGWFDRYVIRHLWNACQAQVEGEQGLKRGTVENKKAASALLEEAIFETQQNSLLTERSAAMRSHNEITKAFTMYSADAMELTGRFLDAFGEVSVLKAKLRHAEGATKTALEAEIKAAQKKARSSAASMVAVSAYMAVIAYIFSKAYGRRDDDETVGDIARDFAADFAGNLLGGLPFIRDIYSYFNDGYEVNTYFLSSINDMLQGANGIKNLVSDAITGKEVTAQEVASRVRSLFYATGQIFGIPIRNMYNATRGVVGVISPDGGYAMDSMFYNKNYRNDLASALEKGDEKKVSTIAQIMLDEDFGGMSSAARKKLKELIEDGYDVLPRSVGDYVTVDGEQLKFTARQRKQFEKVYGVADKAVEDLVRMSKFRKLTSKEQAKAINFIYETYYDLATEDVFGVDLAEKNILFAEAIDIEKLALFVTAARSIEGDKDKNGKTISGSKKAKVTAYVESLNISAAEKYMLMGYLGYKNKNGEAQVKAYINKLRLTKTEKEALLGYSGYEVKKAS